jgi:HD-like signal output (HDOD) protein
VDLHHLISNAQHMPNIPKVVQELIQSFGDDGINSDEIAQKLSKDQSMTVKVLRMANSSQYGGHRKIGSVNDAAVLLGFNALRTMVLASGLTSAFPAPEGFNIKAFWIKSFALASISKWVAKYTPNINVEVAFTCGMIHDIGGLLTHILVNEEAQKIDRIVEKGADRVTMEDSHLGFNFTQAGAELANRWNFPEAIIEGIRHQMQPQVSEDEYQPLAGIIYIAQYIFNNREGDNEVFMANFPLTHAKALGINMATVLDQLDELKEVESGIEELLD